jgi:hypothetical protein
VFPQAYEKQTYETYQKVFPKGYNIVIAFLCTVVLIEMNYLLFSSYSFSAITLESNEDGKSLDRKLEDIWSYRLNLTECSITTEFVITELHCILIICDPKIVSS